MKLGLITLLVGTALGALAGCGGSDASTEAPANEEDVTKLSCSKLEEMEVDWETLLIDGTAAHSDVSSLPAGAKTFYQAHGSYADLAGYKATVAKVATFAITYTPGDKEIVGRVAVFDRGGAQLFTGYWRDSPQIYWQAKGCR